MKKIAILSKERLEIREFSTGELLSSYTFSKFKEFCRKTKYSYKEFVTNTINNILRIEDIPEIEVILA